MSHTKQFAEEQAGIALTSAVLGPEVAPVLETAAGLINAVSEDKKELSRKRKIIARDLKDALRQSTGRKKQKPGNKPRSKFSNQRERRLRKRVQKKATDFYRQKKSGISSSNSRNSRINRNYFPSSSRTHKLLPSFIGRRYSGRARRYRYYWK